MNLNAVQYNLIDVIESRKATSYHAVSRPILVCARSFGMVAGSKFRYNPTVSVSSGVIPGDRAKLNSPTAWCASTNDASQYFQYDFGGIRSINGFAIQGHQSEIKWVTNFKVSYRDQIGHSFTTYQESGLDKVWK